MYPYRAIIERSLGVKCPHITLEKEIKRKQGVNTHVTTIERKRIVIDLNK